MKNAKINKKIIKLWDKYFKDYPNEHGPLFYDDFTPGGIVFVGINPSSSPSGQKTILKDTEYADIKQEEFFLWKNLSKSPKDIAICIEFEKLSFQKYSYFKIMHKIAAELKIPCAHLDIFLYKLTSQEKFKDKIIENGKLNQFAIEQLEIFDEVLTDTKPKIVVIANAYGSELINNYYKNRLRFDSKNGWHFFTLSNGKEVPIFFSSMISGQRSLDIWSRNRLVWHINNALLTQRNI